MRLRPIVEVSDDKRSWLNIREQDFPNRGVVSWWHPSADARDGSAWLFQIEQSRTTYDPNNRHHDLYRVKAAPIQATEVYDIEQADDPEDVRRLLSGEGVPIPSVTTSRLIFRDRTGVLIGPTDLVKRADRLFLDLKVQEVLVVAVQDLEHLPLTQWGGHNFLPPGWSSKRGEHVDFSPDEVFLKRVLRELSTISPALDDVRQAEKLIARFCSSATASPSRMPRYRLERLRKLSNDLSYAAAIPAEALEDFLAIPSIARTLDKAKETAVNSAIVAAKSSLDELERQRAPLQEDVRQLGASLEAGRAELNQMAVQQASALRDFEREVRINFEMSSRNASKFLADVTLLRAALQVPASAVPRLPTKLGRETTDVSLPMVPRAELVSTLRERYRYIGLPYQAADELLLSLMAGFVPLVVGAGARDSINALASIIAGGRLYSATLHPGMICPTDLKETPVIMSASVDDGPATIGELLVSARDTHQLCVLCIEQINLAQIDSVVLPLLRQYGEFRSNNDWTFGALFASSVGAFPSNVLLIGLLIDSPMALPASPELWSIATAVDTDTVEQHTFSGDRLPDQAAPVSEMSLEEWREWVTVATACNPNSSWILSAYLHSRLQMSSTTQRLIGRLCLLSARAIVLAQCHRACPWYPD